MRRIVGAVEQADPGTGEEFVSRSAIGVISVKSRAMSA